MDVRSADLFWDSYKLEPLTADPLKRDMLLSTDFWRGDWLQYRSIQFGDIAPSAIPSSRASDTLRSTGRIEMRDLRLPVHPHPWDRAAIKSRRLWRFITSK